MTTKANTWLARRLVPGEVASPQKAPLLAVRVDLIPIGAVRRGLPRVMARTVPVDWPAKPKKALDNEPGFAG